MKTNHMSHRWPFPKQELATDLDHLFRHLFQETKTGAWAPEWEVAELPDAYRVTVDLPGFSPDDLNIEVKDGKLTVSGKRESVKQSEEEKVHLQERRFGKFQRVIEFQEPVDQDAIGARMSNGVLNISIPKSQKAQAKKIQVESE